MKKRRFVALTDLAMKITVVQLLILVFALSSSAKEVSGQEILNKTISLSVEKARLKNVLHEIQRLAEVKFVFSSMIIDANRKISVSANLGVQQPVNFPDFLDSYNHLLLRKQALNVGCASLKPGN